MTKTTAYHAGISAEQQVEQKYIRSGFEILARRFRRIGPDGGEIDLVARHDDRFYFVEVKKSHSFDAAAQRISARQISRIQNAAVQFLADMGLPMETNMRFDAALVNGSGHIQVIPNAFA